MSNYVRAIEEDFGENSEAVSSVDIEDAIESVLEFMR